MLGSRRPTTSPVAGEQEETVYLSTGRTMLSRGVSGRTGLLDKAVPHLLA